MTEKELKTERFRFEEHLDYVTSDTEWTLICDLMRLWAERHEWDEHKAHMAFSYGMLEFFKLTAKRNGKLFPHFDDSGKKELHPRSYWATYLREQAVKPTGDVPRASQ